MAKKKQASVLDTGIILIDSECFYKMGNSDVIIPITVIEQVDNFKRGCRKINFHARNFMRLLEDMSEDELFNGGVRIAPKKGLLKIRVDLEFNPKIKAMFVKKDSDTRILNSAFCYGLENPEQIVVLFCNDSCMRFKAKALGLKTSLYKVSKIFKR